MSIYEVHLGSWRRVPEEDNRSLSYREIAEPLADYVIEMGFTHVEFLPLTEHPFFGSWGYQTTGYFAPTSRYGTPQDLMYLIDHLHQRGIGVILDWVPSHFPTDEWALGFFDGTHLYEHADPRKGMHKDWDSYIFNYGRHEVRSFLLSSAMFWLEHVSHGWAARGCRRFDALPGLFAQGRRVDSQRFWRPGKHRGRRVPSPLQHAKSTAHIPTFKPSPKNPHPGREYRGPRIWEDLGFGLKWDMGWMNDTLQVHGSRSGTSEVSPESADISDDLRVSREFRPASFPRRSSCMERDLCSARMPGDLWQKFANLRLLFAYQFAQPGKKLLFMGAEFAQWSEWAHDGSLDWHLLGLESHRQVQRWVSDLNHVYRNERSLYELDCDGNGFEWIDCSDADQSMLAFLRRPAAGWRSDPRGVQLHSGTEAGISRRGSLARILERDSQQRCQTLRWCGLRQSRDNNG